jgi:RNA polymerase sigma-70 factor (ECF subfamily)
MMFASPEERSLIQRCLERQPGAWEAFLERYLPLLHHIARKTAHLAGATATPEDLEDCLAEILMEIVSNNFRCLKSFQAESALGTFLLVVARRRASKFWMEKRLAPSPAHSTESQPDRENSGLGSQESTLELGEKLGKLLEKLPASEREAVRLHHLEGYSYSEVASHLRIPVNSVGPLLTKARKRLNKAAQKS